MEPSVRSITLHAGQPSQWDPGAIEGHVERLVYDLLEAHDRASADIGITSWTLRLTLPNPPVDAVGAVTEALAGMDFDGVLVSIGGLPAGHKMLESVISEASREQLYAHLYISNDPEKVWQEARRIAGLMNALAEEDPVMATKVGVNTSGSGILTPFYPLSWSPGDRPRITVALTYPTLLRNAYMDGGREKLIRSAASFAASASKLARGVSQYLKAEFSGVDVSVAPWMRDSSLALVELVAGTRLPDPGISMGISAINSMLAEVARSVDRSTGFNSVQLPVAEDLKLKARAAEGEVRARDLARLSGACLAGLDMVIVPYVEGMVAGLILEVAGYSRAKDKPLGVRLIPLEGVEPGDKISLGRFGETPVIGH